MRRLLLGLLAAALGCQATDRPRTPGRLFGRPAATDTGAGTPARNDWVNGPARRPSADAVADRRQDTLAGVVVLPNDVPARNVPVEIDTGDGRGAPVEIRTDASGSFRIPGLKPEQTYTLTAKAVQGGVPFAGKLYVRTGSAKSQQIRIELVEGAGGVPLPDPVRPPDSGFPAPDMPPLPRPAPGPYDAAIPGPVAAAPAPGAFVETLPPPLVAAVPAEPTPTVTPLPPLTVAPRPDLQAQAEQPFRPAPASVPPLIGPTQTPIAPVGSRKLAPLGTEFTLVDADNVPRDYPSSTEWVLLDFMTTTCKPCQKSVPLLTALQRRYADKNLEVIGLACDPLPVKARQSKMADYAKKHAPGYPLLTEPADEPGALLNRFQIDSYPTLVLLNRAGEVVWRGHPADAQELTQYLR